jgi:hypothetical protein
MEIPALWTYSVDLSLKVSYIKLTETNVKNEKEMKTNTQTSKTKAIHIKSNIYEYSVII